MYPTDKKAQPQYGLDRVEVFYEIMEEGSMSRQMGILLDWEDLGRIGNLRSIRDYFIYEALDGTVSSSISAVPKSLSNRC